MERVLALDIGGHGLKMAWFRNDERGRVERISDVERTDSVDWAHFGWWLADREPLQQVTVAVASAGFTDPERGIVCESRATGWKDYALCEDLIQHGAKAASLLNDGEAHVWAHLDEAHPVLSIALGTSVAIGVTDEQGKLFRPRADRNLDVGDMLLRTQSSRKYAWEGIGDDALKELVIQLGIDAGYEHFGYRVGAFAAQLTNVFQPKTLVISGGLTEQHWNVMERAIGEEMFAALPSWRLDGVSICRSRHGGLAALVGVASYACRRRR